MRQWNLLEPGSKGYSFAQYLRIFGVVLCCAIFLVGCTALGTGKLPTKKLAPVTEGWYKTSSIRSSYSVQPKDTLYSIAWGFGLDYRDIAAVNNLHAPYKLQIGQRIQIVALSHKQTSLAQKLPQKNEITSIFKHQWLWPARGKVVEKFSTKLGKNKGINIAGTLGRPIFACAAGRVVYSGAGIRNYGKLIILKHSDDYLSAYAYNRNILVVEGELVTKGQKIATMGHNNSGVPMLHFEIRRFGKPQNPLLYLPIKRA